jgi:hypothetical protein
MKKIGIHLGNFTIVVTNAREVYGHDDSLPYNADFTLLENNKEVAKGRAFNDGWGGPSNYQFERYSQEQQDAWNRASEYCKANIKYTFRAIEIANDLMDVIDHLVEIAIYSNNADGIYTERAFLNYLNRA